MDSRGKLRWPVLIGCLTAPLTLSSCILLEPQGVQITALPPVTAEPVDVPVAFVVQPGSDGVVYNRIGGEIPRPSPIPETRDVEIGEVTSG